MLYTGVRGSAAGAAITMLDAVLPLNTNWSIYDSAAGTNRKVYECAGGASPFYLDVDDNYTSYYSGQLWVTWDADLHIGGGTPTTKVYWSKDGTSYLISLNDTRAIVGDTETLTNHQSRLCYIGYTKPHPSSDGYVIICGGASSTSDSRNHVANDVSTATYWRALYDPNGGSNATVYILGRSDDPNSTLRKKRDARGRYQDVRESSVYATSCTPRYNLGFLDGICVSGNNERDGLYSWDRIVVDGVDWMFLFDATWACYLRCD